MRKYLIGFLAGVVVATASAAYADEAILIGKQIQGQTTVYKDGEALDSAIIVDGKSYAPTRAIGEAAGYKVSFSAGEIHLQSPVVNQAEPQTGGETVTTQPEPPVRTISQVNTLIQKTKLEIASYKTGIKMNEDLIADNPNHANIESYKAQLETFREGLAKSEAELTTLEAEKAALEQQ